MKTTPLWAPLATLVLLSSARPALAFCPSYTASSLYNDKGCAIEAAAGTNETDGHDGRLGQGFCRHYRIT